MNNLKNSMIPHNPPTLSKEEEDSASRFKGPQPDVKWIIKNFERV